MENKSPQSASPLLQQLENLDVAATVAATADATAVAIADMTADTTAALAASGDNDNGLNAASALPPLYIQAANFPAAADALAKRLAKTGSVFYRGKKAVMVVAGSDGPSVVDLSHLGVVIEAHKICQPIMGTASIPAAQKAVTLPDKIARMTLADTNCLPELKGICHGLFLEADGSIRSEAGYDRKTKMWGRGAEAPPISENPTFEQAAASLLLIRALVATFPFRDRAVDPTGKTDLTQPPGVDESIFITALLTGVCRPSLELAPAILIRAPQISGAGLGKGLLAHMIAIVAFGVSPSAFHVGESTAEFDKRLVSVLRTSPAAALIDNLNGECPHSHLLAQLLTESRVSARLLGRSEMAPLETRALICVTGNGVSILEDLARRFLVSDLDAAVEDPENRHFAGEPFLRVVAKRRCELLGAVLTIWRWGRRNPQAQGTPIGSYETWAEWVRDPLVALGCVDAILKQGEMKTSDPLRERAVRFFQAWAAVYGGQPVIASKLDADLLKLISTHGPSSRQKSASFLNNLVGTRLAGFVITRETHGRWEPATYMLRHFDD